MEREGAGKGRVDIVQAWMTVRAGAGREGRDGGGKGQEGLTLGTAPGATWRQCSTSKGW